MWTSSGPATAAGSLVSWPGRGVAWWSLLELPALSVTQWGCALRGRVCRIPVGKWALVFLVQGAGGDLWILCAGSSPSQPCPGAAESPEVQRPSRAAVLTHCRSELGCVLQVRIPGPGPRRSASFGLGELGVCCFRCPGQRVGTATGHLAYSVPT